MPHKLSKLMQTIGNQGGSYKNPLLFSRMTLKLTRNGQTKVGCQNKNGIVNLIHICASASEKIS